MSRHGIYIYGYDKNGLQVESELPKSPNEETAEKIVEDWDTNMLLTIKLELAAIAIVIARLEWAKSAQIESP